MLENPNIQTASSFACCMKTPVRAPPNSQTTAIILLGIIFFLQHLSIAYILSQMGGFPLKPPYTIEAPRTRPPPQTPNAGTSRFGKCQLPWAWPYSPQPHVTWHRFFVNGKEKSSSVVSTSFKWDEISPLSRLSDNPSYPVISGHLYGFLTPFITRFFLGAHLVTIQPNYQSLGILAHLLRMVAWNLKTTCVSEVMKDTPNHHLRIWRLIPSFFCFLAEFVEMIQFDYIIFFRWVETTNWSQD